MSEIISINLRKESDKWVFSVVRDDDYREISADDTNPIKQQIKDLLEFAMKMKTVEQKKVEEAEKKAEKIFEKLVEKVKEEDLLKMPEIVIRWRVDTEYRVGDFRNYNEEIYKCKKSHKSTYETIPSLASVYWRKAVEKDKLPELYNHEKKYKVNEKCVFNRKIYTSLIEQEGQSPFASPKTWEDEGGI